MTRKTAYLDIETTGLSPSYDELTVIGVCLEDSLGLRMVQLVGDRITSANLLAALKGARTLFTFNGSRFDLPFIREKLGLDLEESFDHHDLMYDCWRKNLYGGLKRVEGLLGIGRCLAGLDGFAAVRLWRDYKELGNKRSLRTLLEYNKEDVLNLRLLRGKLNPKPE